LWYNYSMISQDQKQRITKSLQAHPEVMLAYLFGSQASGDTGPLSDFDIAVYFDESNVSGAADLRLELLAELGRVLRTDNVDLVLLNQVDNPTLKYNIITTGQLLFEREPYQLLVEPRILNEYFDFRSLLIRHKLTKVTTAV
jgi:predicted nucleotidyltransferase